MDFSPKLISCMQNSLKFIFRNVVVTSVTKSLTMDAILGEP